MNSFVNTTEIDFLNYFHNRQALISNAFSLHICSLMLLHPLIILQTDPNTNNRYSQSDGIDFIIYFASVHTECVSKLQGRCLAQRQHVVSMKVH